MKKVVKYIRVSPLTQETIKQNEYILQLIAKMLKESTDESP